MILIFYLLLLLLSISFDTISHIVTFDTVLWYEKNNLIYCIKSVRILYRNNRVTGWLTSVLFYIEWGWCWWTIIILISKTLWLLACSFLHCWHSFLRLSDNVLRHRKTTPELWRAMEWIFQNHTLRSTHLVGGCSLFVS